MSDQKKLIDITDVPALAKLLGKVKILTSKNKPEQFLTDKDGYVRDAAREMLENPEKSNGS